VYLIEKAFMHHVLQRRQSILQRGKQCGARVKYPSSPEDIGTRADLLSSSCCYDPPENDEDRKTANVIIVG
jgi:hypothetical protein